MTILPGGKDQMEKSPSRAAGETMSEERRQPEGRMSRAVGETTALADPQGEAQPNKSVKSGGVYF